MPDMSFEPLTPTSFLDRSGLVFPDACAVVDGDRRWTYRELQERARRLAGALTAAGVSQGDRVAVLAPNTSMQLEAHFGVPWAGAVIVALNIRLTAAELTYIVDHSEARVLIHDASVAEIARQVAHTARSSLTVIEAGSTDSEYEEWLVTADEVALAVNDERDLLALNYTSGTTGSPKGVAYHHRGAYLQSLAMAFHSRLNSDSVFLWTLPMFHCNGWCFPWAVTAAGATHLCLHQVDPGGIWRHIAADGVTHFNAAPTVLTTLADHRDASPAPNPLRVGTGGAPPSPTLLAQMAALNMDVTHLYGLTETFGPVGLCDWHSEWNDLGPDEQARLKARQGVGNVISSRVRVVDDEGNDLPADGSTMGQVVVRGNNVMLGYHRDPQATEAASLDGWFLTGDLGVMHPDGYVELRDRAKDIIISGGENISTIEVEQAIASHPAVLEVAVVGTPHDRWGEVPAAHVALRDDALATEDEIIAYARDRLASFKAPKHVVLGPLPKTSTGKIQKFKLRQAAWAGHDRAIG